MRIWSLKTYVHSPRCKIISMVIIFGCLFFAPTFASTTDGSLTTLKERLHTAISLFSRWWVILAVLAGKLMTNDFVYGAFIHMDIYLWKIWNIAKNFANFALIGLVLWSIIKSLTGKEALDVKKIIIRTLAAGVLIQASRFLVGAVIDLSTVATSAIWSFSTTFFQNNEALNNMVTTSLSNIKKNRIVVTLHEWNTKVENLPIPDTAPDSSSPPSDRSNILPNYNSISGPFIFLGMGVFQFQEWIGLWDTTNDASSLTVSFMLRFVILAMFTLWLLLLFIANIMRVGLLWVFIIGSPFLILIQSFSLKMDDKWFGKLFSLSNFLWLVFKPLIFVAGISLMLIVVLSMRNTMKDTTTWENNLPGINLSTEGTKSTLSIEGITNIEATQQDLFGKNVMEAGQNVFSTLIVFVLTTFLIRWFIKLSLTLGWWPLQEPMKKMVWRAEWLGKTMPILPSWISFVWLQKFSEESRTHMAHGLGMSEHWEFGWMDANGNFQTNYDTFNSRIGQKYLWLLPSRDPQDYTSLKDLAEKWNIESFFSTSRTLAEQRSGWLSIQNTKRMEALQTALNKNPSTARTMGFDGTITNINEEELKQYFTIEANRKALYNAMWWDTATKQSLPKDYEGFKDMVFYPSK